MFPPTPRISSLASILETTFTAVRWRWLADTLRLAVRRGIFSRIYDRSAAALVREHFAGVDPHAIVTSSRTFPGYMRVDLNRTLERLLPRSEIHCVGLHERYGHQTLEYATLLHPDGHVSLAPLRFDDVDIGEATAAHCLGTALWLIPAKETRAAHVVLLSPAKRYGHMGGWHVEIAVPACAAGEAVVAGIFEALEAALTRSASYRGKVLSLEREEHMMETGASVLVHRLAPVAREEVILPAVTLDLLERNVFQFAARRRGARRAAVLGGGG
jgi:hypothetical protein